MPMTKEELDALTKHANEQAALFMQPKIEEADALLGEAFSAAWLDRYRAFIGSLPDGDLKLQLLNMLSVIEHMPVFFSNQRTVIARHLPPTPPAAPPPPAAAAPPAA